VKHSRSKVCFLTTVVILSVALTSACDSNAPPQQPSNPFPDDGAIAQDTSLVVTWDCHDPDGETLVYTDHNGYSQVRSALSFDLYLDTEPDPAEIVQSTNDYFYQARSLEFATTYYWKVVASDGEDSTHGPVWRFTTRTN